MAARERDGLKAVPYRSAYRRVAWFFVGALLLLGPVLFTPYWLGLLTQVMVFAVLAMSLDILLGYTGLPSLGHAGLFGVAAYAVAVLSTAHHASFWVCVIGGIVAGTLVSAVFGLFVSHVRDVYFLMITLALGMVVWGLSYRWIPVTGGDNGISGIPRLMTGPITFYEVTLLTVIACTALMMLFISSPFG